MSHDLKELFAQFDWVQRSLILEIAISRQSLVQALACQTVVDPRFAYTRGRARLSG